MNRKAFISLFTSLIVAFTTIGSVTAQEPQPTTPVQAAVLADSAGTPVGSAITYQGQLKQNGNPANGNFDFQFILYDAASGGSQQGATLQLNNVTVNSGVFNVQLDFGQTVFNGDARFLEVGVKPVSSAEPYTVLSPRTSLSAVPYALAMPGVTAQNGIITVGGRLHMAGEDFVMLPTPRGDGGRAIVHDGGDTLVLNYGGDFTGGARVDSSLLVNGRMYMTGTDFRMMPNERGNGGLALVHDADNTLVLNFGREFTGGTRIDGMLRVAGSFLRVDAEDQAAYIGGQFFGGYVLVGSQNPNTENVWLLNAATGNDMNLVAKNIVARGSTHTDVLQITGGGDLAELFSQADGALVEPGTVMVIDPEHAGNLKMSTVAYDHKVAGIVSGAGDVNPGLTLQQEGVLDGNLSVAIAGRVYVKAEAHSSAIEPGDLLTTSDMAGYAMKATNSKLSHGTIIGKAMTRLQDGTGLVLVLVNLQ